MSVNYIIFGRNSNYRTCNFFRSSLLWRKIIIRLKLKLLVVYSFSTFFLRLPLRFFGCNSKCDVLFLLHRDGLPLDLLGWDDESDETHRLIVCSMLIEVAYGFFLALFFRSFFSQPFGLFFTFLSPMLMDTFRRSWWSFVSISYKLLCDRFTFINSALFLSNILRNESINSFLLSSSVIWPWQMILIFKLKI